MSNSSVSVTAGDIIKSTALRRSTQNLISLEQVLLSSKIFVKI